MSHLACQTLTSSSASLSTSAAEVIQSAGMFDSFFCRLLRWPNCTALDVQSSVMTWISVPVAISDAVKAGTWANMRGSNIYIYTYCECSVLEFLTCKSQKQDQQQTNALDTFKLIEYPNHTWFSAWTHREKKTWKKSQLEQWIWPGSLPLTRLKSAMKAGPWEPSWLKSKCHHICLSHPAHGSKWGSTI